MPKVERTQLRTRLVTEYGDFTEIDGELQCKFCATKVPNLKKSLIVQHLKTKRHRENKQRSQQDEAVQEEGLEDEETVEQQLPPAQKNFNRDLCKALISSNIPLNNVNSTPFSSFLRKYTAYTVPDQSTLRKYHVQDLYKETWSDLRHKVDGKKLWVSLDETSDVEQSVSVIMNDGEKDVKIPEGLCIKKEHHDPNEIWLDIKEESVEYSAQADDVREYREYPKQESDDGSIPDSLNQTSVCKGANFEVYQDAQLKRDDVEYNASCDTTGIHQPTSLLPPIEQVFVDDLPYSEGERTSTCEKIRTGISQEESSGLEENQKDIKSEEDGYLSENYLEIKEEIPSYDSYSDDTNDVQSSYLLPFPEGKGNPVVHKSTETKEKPFICDVCNKAFARKSGLVDHIRVHTKERPFSCDVCNKAFGRKPNLVKHMQIHTKERPFTCDECSKTFTQKSTLVEHMRVHTKERPYSCDICNKAFSNKSNLVSHKRLHTKEKPFNCDVCNKAFGRKSNLVVHMRIHTKERPFTCDLCDQAFTQKTTLVKHVERHKKKKPFTCEISNKTFAVNYSLGAHQYTLTHDVYNGGNIHESS